MHPEGKDQPCFGCQKLFAKGLLTEWRLPCLRWKLSNTVLCKPGPVPGYEWSRRWQVDKEYQIRNWENQEEKEIYLADSFNMIVVKLRVRRFVPQVGDKLQRTWDHQGVRHSVDIPPYALIELEKGSQEYSENLMSERSLGVMFKQLLGPPDGLIFKTYQWACITIGGSPLAEERELFELTFKLWMAVRLSTTSGFIVGQETLGMSRTILDETSPDHGRIPMPPVLGAQLDVVLIHRIVGQLKQKVMARLGAIVEKRDPKQWAVIYLVSFILLHNAALITAHDAKYAEKHGMKVRVTFHSNPLPVY